MKLPKKPNINFKAIIQKFSVFKNNVPLLISIIITFVSILILIPGRLISGSLKNQIQTTSIDDGSAKIKRFLNTIGSAEQWEIEEQQLEVLSIDADEIASLTKQTTLRNFLKKDIYTADISSSYFSPMIFTQFGRLYCNGIDKMITDSNGGAPLTENEVAIQVDNETSQFKTNISNTNYIAPTRRVSSSSGFTGIEQLIAEQICQQRAASISYYANPESVSGYIYMQNYLYTDIDTALKDCWYYQLAYWVIEDIFQTIEKMNEGHENAITSPFKRLMETDFDNGINRSLVIDFSTSGAESLDSSSSSNSKPHYVLSVLDGLTEAFTGRSCDNNIDVIHFRLRAVIATKAIFDFFNELCSVKEHTYVDDSGEERHFQHNQITILESSIRPFYPESADHQFYYYGDENVVELDVVCEYIFIKDGYNNIKPDTIKLALGEELEILE